MALMLPLMLVLIFTTFEAGHYFYSEHKIIKSVRQGARYAARLPFDNFTCPASVDAGAVTQIQTVTRTGSPNGTTSRISGMENSNITVTVACNSGTTTGIYQGKAGGAPVITVAARTNYTSLFSFLLDEGEMPVIRASAQAAVNGI
ncbi:hypothetical protein MTsPCn3_05890 [Erythrobacter sp. MTPC3]